LNRLLVFLTVAFAWSLPAIATTPSAPAKPTVKSGEASFVAGTPVATEDGKKLIEKIKSGDRIWATDPQSRKSANHKVANLSAQDASGLVDVLTASREKIETTPASLFWVNTKGWIAAKALFPGDQLLQRDGTFTQVFNIIPKYTVKATVYSVALDSVYTYYVGKKGILVHGASK
jgi:hypothetical protein